MFFLQHISQSSKRKREDRDDKTPAKTFKKFKTGKTSVFVTNIAPKTTSDELRSKLMQFGSISNYFYTPGKKFAFVSFETKEQSEDAIESSGQLMVIA